jgi:hypothetical protein
MQSGLVVVRASQCVRGMLRYFSFGVMTTFKVTTAVLSEPVLDLGPAVYLQSGSRHAQDMLHQLQLCMLRLTRL